MQKLSSKISLADFQEALDVMFWGIVNPTLAVLPHMLERRGGRIANITSIGGKVSVPHLLPYCASKFAVEGLTQSVAREAQSLLHAFKLQT